MQTEKSKHTFTKFAISGGVSGLCTAIFCYPLDTIKTRLQASNNKVNYMELTKNISLYKGLSASLMNVPLAATYLGVYESFKQYVQRTYKITDPGLLIPISACLGQTLSTTIGTPLEVIKQQLQISVKNNLKENLHYIYKENGLKGFWAGYSASLLRNVPFSVINMTTYETLKKRSKKSNKDAQLSFIQNASNGLISTCGTAFITYPMDLVKTKLMTQRDRHYKGVFDCIKKR